MAIPFSKTLRSLEADRSRISIVGFIVISTLLTAWGLWLLKGRVAVYAVSSSARIEADGAIHPVQSLYAGRIARNHLSLGKHVRAGDVLVEFDDNVQRFQLLEERAQGNALKVELATLEREIGAETQAMREADLAAELGVEEAKARLRRAEADAAFASLDAERKVKLNAAGLASRLDVDRAKAEAQKLSAAASELRLAIDRQAKEGTVKSIERNSHLEALRRQLNQLTGAGTRLGAALNRLESELDLHRIVAPVSGRIGEVAILKSGAVISAGEKIATIVPDGVLRVVAQFEPAKAVGRVRAGQRARIRLEGFPWTQYGTLSATVSSVSSEVRGGLLRVELNPSPSTITLQHGLPGVTEVELEHVSPAVLLLRLSGQMLAGEQREPSRAESAPGIEDRSQ